MLRKKVEDISSKESVIVSRSIVQLTASNVSIKNVLTIKGTVEKKIEQSSTNVENQTEENNNTNNNNQTSQNEEDETTQEKASYKITLNLTEETLKKVKESQEVEIKLQKEEKELKYQGKIAKIENDAENNIHTATIEFNYDENVQENLEVTCTIIVEEAKDVIAVPLAAVKTREKEENVQNAENLESFQNSENLSSSQNLENPSENQAKEEKYVIVVNDDGTTSEVVVETGISDDSYVEITSGLSEGQKVQIVEE